MGRIWDWLAPRGWHRRAMPPFSVWTKYRDLPVMAKRPFFKQWDDLDLSA